MIVTLTIVRYRKRYIPFALLAMALHRLPWLFEKRCTFWKLLGTGKNGSFSLNPDWQQWGLLAAWNSQEDYTKFSRSSFISKWWKIFCYEQWTIVCVPLSGHGQWDKKVPFEYTADNDYNGPIAVLTRATIRFNRLKNFWKHVDPVAKIMRNTSGYITSVGIGEAPLYRQATFSVWENMDTLKNFAYNSQEHAEVIRKTRAESWYSEELFARFKPIASYGSLHGTNPLNLL